MLPQKGAQIGHAGTYRFLVKRVTNLHPGRMADYRPGDLFLDRYMPDASEADREDAYERLRELISILVSIERRLEQENSNSRDSVC